MSSRQLRIQKMWILWKSSRLNFGTRWTSKTTKVRISHEKRIEPGIQKSNGLWIIHAKLIVNSLQLYTTMLSNPINPTLPKTNSCSNRKTIVFQPPSFGCKLFAVSLLEDNLSICWFQPGWKIWNILNWEVFSRLEWKNIAKILKRHWDLRPPPISRNRRYPSIRATLDPLSTMDSPRAQIDTFELQLFEPGGRPRGCFNQTQ